VKQRRHTTEQVIHKLREADALLASGSTVADGCKQIGVSEATYHRCERCTLGLSPTRFGVCALWRKRTRG